MAKIHPPIVIRYECSVSVQKLVTNSDALLQRLKFNLPKVQPYMKNQARQKGELYDLLLAI